MSLTRNDNWTEQETNLSNLGKALASPVRVRILNLITENIAMTSTEIAHKMKRSTSTIHQHIEFLNQANLLQSEYVFHKLYFTLNQKAELSSFLNSKN